MSEKLNAGSIIDMLNLTPLSGEGGFFRQTYINGDHEHPISTAIYYLITPESFSSLHRLTSDEIFHFYAGDAFQMVQLDPAGRLSEHVIGNDLIRGEQPQVVVPGESWQGTRLCDSGEWALLGTTMTPGYAASDFELGTKDRFRDCPDDVRARLAPFIARYVPGGW